MPGNRPEIASRLLPTNNTFEPRPQPEGKGGRQAERSDPLPDGKRVWHSFLSGECLSASAVGGYVLTSTTSQATPDPRRQGRRKAAAGEPLP